MPRHRQNPSTAPSEPRESNLNKLCAASQAFPCLLKGLHKLDDMPQSRAMRGQVIWSFVRMFDDLLERVCYLSATPTAEAPFTMPSSMKTRTQSLQHHAVTSNERSTGPSLRSACLACIERKMRCDEQIPTCGNCQRMRTECKRGAPLCFTRASSKPTLFIPPPENALRLCELAITIMAHLDIEKDTDTEVLEGFLFFLLRRVGQGFKQFLFGVEEDYTSQAQDSNGTQSMAQANPSQRETVITEVAEAQAPCLVWILEQALAYTANLNPTVQASRALGNARKRSTSSTSEPRTASLSALARRRLQHTLVTAVFGDQVRADFQPALKPPGTPLQEKLSANFARGIRTHGVKDWFKHEVWRIMGWDVLKGRLEFGEAGQ